MTNADELLDLAQQLRETSSSRETLTILAEMALLVKEAQKIWTIVEDVKAKLAEDRSIPALEDMSATEPADDTIDLDLDPYAHLTALVNERK